MCRCEFEDENGFSVANQLNRIFFEIWKLQMLFSTTQIPLQLEQYKNCEHFNLIQSFSMLLN